MTRLQLSIIFTFLLVAHSSTFAVEQSVQQRLQKAQDAHQRGDSNAAIIELRNLLQEQPQNSELRGILGRWHLERGDSAAAERELSMARQQQAVPDPEVLLDLARTWLSQNAFQRVLLELNSNPSFNTEQNLKLHIYRARAFAGLDFPDRAASELLRADKIHNNYWEIALERARISLIGKRPKQALKQLREIPAQHQNQTIVQMMFAIAHQRNGNLQLARQALDSVLLLSPDFHSARSTRIWIGLAQGDVETAREDVLYFSSVGTDDRLKKHFTAFKLFLDGQFQQAQKAFEDLLNVYPENNGSSILLALTHLAQHNYEQTIKLLRPFAARFPATVGIRLALAEALIQANRPNRALGHLNDVLEQHPGHPQASKLATRAYLKLNRADDSINMLRQAVTRNPDDASLQAQLALSREKAGKGDKAERKLLQHFKKDPNDIGTLTALSALHLQKRQYDEARKYLIKGLEQQPDQSYLQQLVAMSYIAQNNPEPAWSIVTKGLREQRNFFDSAKLLALLYLQRNNPDKARFLVDKLLDQYQSNAEIHNLHGGLLVSENQLALAEIAFAKAIELRPTFIGAYLNLAKLAMATKRADKALVHYQDALKQSPNNAKLHMLAARASLALKKSDDAVEHMRRGYAAEPNNIDILLALTRQLLSQRNYSDALHVSKDTVGRHPKVAQGWRNLAIAELGIENIEGARNASNTMLSLDPESSDAFFLRARIEQRATKLDEAMQWVEKSLDLQPNNFEANQAKAEIALLRGDGVTAHAAALVLQKEYPENEIGFALEGNLLNRTQQYTKAAKAYAKAVELKPKASYVINLAQALQKSGQTEQAKKVLENWLLSNPEHQGVREALALIWYQLGQPTKAARALEELLGEQPDELRLLNNLAWIYSELNDGRALTYAKRAYSLSPATATIADTYGWLLARRGKARQAVELLQQAADTEPENGQYRYHLAVALSQAGMHTSAKLEAQTLIKEHPDFKSKANDLLKTLP